LRSHEAWIIARLDAHDQAALVKEGVLPPDALVEAAILRIEELDPALNSVSHRAFDHARTALRGIDLTAAMAGVPMLLKASLAYPGFPRTSCSRAQRDVISTGAFPYAHALDAHGLVPVGMSTMPEFGLLCSGEPLLTGPTLNPWDAAYTAGGSSTGAGVAVATGLVPLAHASDAGGSIRVPASNCGVIGFKPSRGWNLRARAHHMIDDLLCSDSLIARSVRDVAWGLRMARPADGGAAPGSRRRLRIALDLDGMDGTADPDVANAIRETATLCETLGHHVEVASMTINRAALRAAFLTLMPYLGGAVVDHFTALRPDVPIGELLEPWTIGLGRARETIEAQDLARCFAAIADGERAITAFFECFDVVLSPVTRSKPLSVGAMAPTRAFEELWDTLFSYIDYTPIHNMVGTPSVSLPLGMSSDCLPIGSLLSAAQGHDDVLLALAAELEQNAPWYGRWPAIAGAHVA
jgi:amidase